MAARTGAHVVEGDISLPLTSEHQFTNDLKNKFTENTKVLFLSHITSETALLFPIQNIILEAKKRGIITIIDGAHVPGHISLDLNALGADFYVGNCHKWVMAPKGSAFLYAAPNRRKMLNPLVISHGWTEALPSNQATGAFGNPAFIDGNEIQGTRDPSALLSVPSALEFAKKNDWEEVKKSCAKLAQSTAKRVAKLTGLPPFSHSDFCAPQMVAMPIPSVDPFALNLKLLNEFGIEIPVYDWRGHTIVRLSVQGYNNQTQMDALVTALKQTLNF